MHVPAILRDFPGAKIVCIVRDGRDNALSLNAMPWWHGTLPGAARLWARCARLTAEFAARYPEHFRVARYEALVARPEDAVRWVTTWLGETFESTQLDPSIPSAVVLPRSVSWKAAALRFIYAGQADRRRRGATARQIARIEAIIAPELRLHGYGPFAG